MLMFYYLTNFHCLIAFTSSDIGQYVIAIVCFPDCGVTFEINAVFVVKPFFDMIRNSRQKFKYLEKERRAYKRAQRASKVKQKAFFIIFKRLSVATNYLRPKIAPLGKVSTLESYFIEKEVNKNAFMEISTIFYLYGHYCPCIESLPCWLSLLLYLNYNIYIHQLAIFRK